MLLHLVSSESCMSVHEFTRFGLFFVSLQVIIRTPFSVGLGIKRILDFSVPTENTLNILSIVGKQASSRILFSLVPADLMNALMSFFSSKPSSLPNHFSISWPHLFANSINKCCENPS